MQCFGRNLRPHSEWLVLFPMRRGTERARRFQPRLEQPEVRTVPALFGAASAIPLNVDLNAVTSADVNGDGKADLIAAQVDSEIAIFLGQSDGTFQAARALGVGTQALSLQVGDFSRGPGQPYFQPQTGSRD